MNIISSEIITDKLNTTYPITLIKFLLNKRKILSYFNKAGTDKFQIRGYQYKIDHSDCNFCKEKEKINVLCRQHTSIERILTAKEVSLDLSTDTYFYKNEIFKFINNKLIIVYCPHPKLIQGDITDSKVRKISPTTIIDPSLKELPKYDKINQFNSDDLLSKNIKCWFNKNLSLVTYTIGNCVEWCLIPNNLI